jgi:hypothetical protein
MQVYQLFAGWSASGQLMRRSTKEMIAGAPR